MVREVVENLHIKKGSKIIDATMGTGGHTFAILEAGGEVLGIDADPEMIAIARNRLEGQKNVKLVEGNFVDIDALAKENGFYPADGIIFDLGVSNIHLKSLERGFSFENSDADLDMRLNPMAQGVKGSDLLNVLREDQLRELFEVTLEPGAAKWITGRVLHSRGIKPVKTVGDLLEISEGLKTGKSGIREATLPFLAVRIAVNSELDNIRGALPKAVDLLQEGGKLVVISFHSGEDRIVKEAIGGKLVLPTGDEINKNPRSRSAKMRVYGK